MNANALLGSLVSLLAVTLCSAQPQPGTVLWTYDVPTSCAPALASDGTIYVGDYYGLQAITNAGSSASIKWAFPATSVSGISVGLDGVIYLANGSQYFYAVNPDGSQKWAYTFEGNGSSQPAIAHDGTIYVVADGNLYALTPAGTKKWSRAIGGNGGIPAITANGTIYVRLNEGATNFYAFNSDGSLNWAKSLNSGTFFSYPNRGISVAIGGEGTVYVGGAGLYALTPEGSQLWYINTNSYAGAVVGSEEAIYSGGSIYDHLYALQSSGENKWHIDFPYRCASRFCWQPQSPAIDDAGTLYYAASNSIFAITADGEVQWVVSHPNPGGHPILDATSPLIGTDGTIYATLTNRLFAIAGTNSPANSPWPMYQQNARRTGKVEKPVLLNTERRSDANFQFQLYWQLGQSNLIETSTNLTSWTPLTNVVITNVPQDVVDLTTSNSPTRFYRAVAP